MTQPQLITMDFDTWFEKFKPVVNENGDSGMIVDDKSYMFETYGADMERVQQAKPECVWTMMDDDEGKDTLIGDGFHRVNRIGHFITEVPAEPNCFYEISMD